MRVILLPLGVRVGERINPATDASSTYNDLNNVLKVGIYCFSNLSEVTNKPNGKNFNAVGTMIVSSYAGTVRVMQTLISYNGYFAARFLESTGTWTPWQFQGYAII